MNNNSEKFKKTAAANGITVKELKEVKGTLEDMGYNFEDYFTKSDVSVVKALSANASEASALIDISDQEKLSCIMDAEKLTILIDEKKIFDDMHSAYKEAYKSKSTGYMIFVSQESKTADIEKQLISGVQGAKKIEFVIV